jgi:hypothetical protein
MDTDCFLSQYACTNNQANVNTCQFIASSTSMAVITCESGTSAGFTYLQAPITISNTVTDFTLYAPLVQINWQSTDLSSSSPATTSSSGSSPATTTPSNFTPTGSAGQSTSSGTTSMVTNSGISTGA